MKNITFKFITLLFLAIFSCKQNENEDIIDSPQTVEEISRMQIITIHTEKALSSEEYNAKLGTTSIKVIKAGDSKLTFIVPSDQALGDNILEVPILNLKLNYVVKNAILADTPQNVMNGYFANLDSFTSILDASSQSENTKKNIANIKKVFSTAKVEDQNRMALFYQVNKAFYDQIVNYNYDDIKAKEGDYDENYNANLNLSKKKASVLAFAVCNAVMILAPDAWVKAIAFAGVVVTLQDAYKFGKAFINEKMLVYENNVTEKTASIITLSDGINKTLNFTTKRRSVISSDVSSKLEKFILFFETLNKFNDLVVSKNNVAKWLNEHIPFSNFEISELIKLPQNSENTTIAVNNSYFKRYNFSIPNSDVSLTSLTFKSNGKIDINAKITNTNLNSVSTTLNYSYKDDYNSLSSNIPITINKDNVLSGTWKMDFTLAPVDQNCDEIDLEDETHIPPTLHFNPNGTITFDSIYDPAILVDANNPNICTNIYEFVNNTLKITIHFRDGNEESKNISTMTYNNQTGTFTGTYSYTYWYNGTMEQNCSNVVKLSKK